jgi:PAS domain S-box-containing protein
MHFAGAGRGGTHTNRPRLAPFSDEQEQTVTGDRSSTNAPQIEEHYRRAVLCAPFPVMLQADDGEVVLVNDAWAKITGYSLSDIPTIDAWAEKAYGQDAAAVVQEVDRFFESQGERYEGVFNVRCANGESRVWEFSAVSLGQMVDGRQLAMSAARDITNRSRMEAELRRASTLLEQAFEQSPVPMVLVSLPDGVLRIVNPACRDYLGIADEPLRIGTPLHLFVPSYRDLDPNGDAGAVEDLPLPRALRGETTLNVERHIIRKDGTSRWGLASGVPIRDAHGELLAGYMVMTDTTETKHAEEGLERTTKALKTLSRVNEALVRAQAEDELLEDVCKAIIASGGYALAWVGFAQDDERKSVVPVHSAGESVDYAKSLLVSWGDGPYGRGPTGRSIREVRPVALRNMDTDPDYAPWKAAAAAYGFRASMSLPLVSNDGSAYGALVLYSRDTDAFEEEEVALLVEMADDLSYGIETLRARERRAQIESDLVVSNERLEGLLHSIVETMGKVVETRDPYTQGHEANVATLCKLIANEMGMPDDDIAMIEIAALVHDIGKLRVPAEILTKPGRLSNAEFQIIREHPRAG